MMLPLFFVYTLIYANLFYHFLSYVYSSCLLSLVVGSQETKRIGEYVRRDAISSSSLKYPRSNHS